MARWLTRLAGMLSVVAGVSHGQDTVRVVANGAPRWGPAPRLTEVLRVGQLDGLPEYAFGNLAHLAVDSRNRFYTYDQNDRQIRAYDAAGKFVGLVGRRGKGPGEYETVAAMGVGRDSLLVVHDPSTARVTYFSHQGALRRSHPIDPNVFYGSGFLIDVADRLYVQVPMAGGPAEGLGARYQLRRYRGPQVVDSIRIPGARRSGRHFALVTTDGMRYSFPREWVWWPYARGGVVAADNDRYAFVIDTGGPRVRLVERPQPRVELGKEERREWIAKGEFFTRTRQGAPTYSIAEDKPYIRAMRSDDLGRVWVQVYVTAERRTGLPPTARDGAPQLTWRERSTWDVFAPDGAFLGRIVLPPESQLLTIRGDRIWVRTADADGSDRLVVYELPTAGR
jgi:6-bladed beta-propeller